MNPIPPDHPSVLLDFARRVASFGDQIPVRFSIGDVHLLGTGGSDPGTLGLRH